MPEGIVGRSGIAEGCKRAAKIGPRYVVQRILGDRLMIRGDGFFQPADLHQIIGVPQQYAAVGGLTRQCLPVVRLRPGPLAAQAGP